MFAILEKSEVLKKSCLFQMLHRVKDVFVSDKHEKRQLEDKISLRFTLIWQNHEYLEWNAYGIWDASTIAATLSFTKQNTCVTRQHTSFGVV